MASMQDPSRFGRWLKTIRNPPRYLSASLIVSLGGLLNGYVIHRAFITVIVD